MCTEAAATVAEIAAGLWNCPGCDTDGFCFGGDVDHPDDLPIFQTFVRGGFADRSDKVPACLGSLGGGVTVIVIDAGGCSGTGPELLLPKLTEPHAQEWEGCVCCHLGTP